MIPMDAVPAARAARRLACLAAAAALLLAGGCRRPPAEWTPLLEGSTAGVLAGEVETALEAARAAREAIPAEAEGDEGDGSGPAGRHLAEAVTVLERLDAYYLPLLDIRERAHDAYHHHVDLDQRERAQEEVRTIEDRLVGMAGYGGPAVAGELGSLLELAAEARVAMASDDPEAGDLLLELADHVHQMLLKADLVLK